MSRVGASAVDMGARGEATIPDVWSASASNPAYAPAVDPGLATLPPPLDAVVTPPLDSYSLLRDQVRGTFAFNRTALTGHFVGAFIIELIYASVAPFDLLLGWGVLFYSVWLVRLGLAWHYARSPEPTSAAVLLRRLRTWQVSAVCAGALWGSAAWFFYPYGSGPHQMALVLVVYTFCVGSVPVLATQFRLFVLFVLLVFTPAISVVALPGTELAIGLAVVMTVAMGMIVVLGGNYRDAFEASVALKQRSEALAERLRIEMVAADEARNAAEIANRAKTQFFTAASHDLRQPLHAMGLFAEALRSRTHDSEVAPLVNSINESVDALEGLFSELLDITRIDSGGVRVEPESFGVGDIFRKLKLNFEPSAFEKGLELRFRGHRHIAHADPMLVERILRNLVSNAVRYTEDGTVLVSARRHRDRILLQVWDTGPGLHEDEQARIFEEFYQVPGRVAQGEQKRGLGLGLAIVRRLANLMDASLTMRSRVGHGTVFTLALPVGRVTRAGVQTAPGKGPIGLTLHGKRIVIVEDEPAVRAGLEVLLQGWGASIVAFDSVQAVRSWIAGLGAEAPAPALVIADYRLEPGETGVAAIDALRAHFGQALPAIVVTGSTMSGHENEAHDKDFHVLIKPVLPNKLRAMIAFKLRTRESRPDSRG